MPSYDEDLLCLIFDNESEAITVSRTSLILPIKAGETLSLSTIHLQSKASGKVLKHTSAKRTM